MKTVTELPLQDCQPGREEVARGARMRPLLGTEFFVNFPISTQDGGIGLTCSHIIEGAARVGCHALVLGRVAAAFVRGSM